MEQEPGRLTDGFVDATRGADSSKPSNLIPRNAVSWAINVTCRGGYPSTRPRYLQRFLTFANSDQQTAYQQGNLQGAAYYRPANGDPFHVVSVAGHIYKVDSHFNVEELTHGDVNASNLDRVWMCQVEQYLVIQDGQSAAFVFDGATLHRSIESAGGVPVGTCMAYGQRRLAVARGREIFFGDVAGGPTSPVSFTENAQVDIGGSWTIAFPGLITGLCYLPVLDATTGQGELTAHTPYGISTFKTYLPRASWKTTVQFETIAFLPFGGISADALVPVNSDLWFRSRDGIRSLTIVIRDNQGGWINTPQSTEVARALDKDQPELAPFCNAILFDNRLLTTVGTTWQNGKIYFKGLIVLDYDLISSLFEKADPAYDGLWTGLNISKLVVGDYNGKDRAFAYTVNDQSQNELWELTTDKGDDNDETRIAASIEAASYLFGNPREEKQLDAAEVFVDELSGTVDFDLQYRPDEYPIWIDWKSWTVCAPSSNCDPISGCLSIQTLKPQYRPKMMITKPPILKELGAFKPSNIGFEFQPRLAWTGVARIRMLFLHCLPVLERPYGKCPPVSETCQSLAGCDLNDFEYEA